MLTPTPPLAGIPMERSPHAPIPLMLGLLAASALLTVPTGCAGAPSGPRRADDAAALAAPPAPAVRPATDPVVRVGLRSISGQDGVTLAAPEDRKSKRLNSSHSQISYTVFCLKKKKT